MHFSLCEFVSKYILNSNFFYTMKKYIAADNLTYVLQIATINTLRHFRYFNIKIRSINNNTSFSVH